MTATQLVPVAPHVPVRRTGARPGALHAALEENGSWRTACGELLSDSPRGIVAPVPLEEAWKLIHSESPLLCRRCDRAGNTVAGAE